MSDTPWWEAAFAATYLQVYAHRDDADARAEVAGIEAMLTSAPAGPVLDACCGNGRHLAALREAGHDAWGFDYSSDLLQVAAARPLCQGRLVRADLRAPPFADRRFQAVLLFFTAFGYFDDPVNARVLTRLARLLAPGGLLMLDLPDPEHLRTSLIPYSERRLADGTHLVEHRRFVAGRVEKDVALALPDGRSHAYTESVRIYEAEELAALALGAGLHVLERWPSLRGPATPQNRWVVWLRIAS